MQKTQTRSKVCFPSFFKLAKFDVSRLYLFPDFLNVGQCVRKRLEWANVAKLVENSLLFRLILATASKRSGNNVFLVVLINVAQIEEATLKIVCFRLERASDAKIA